ncbi:uncharacterized protein LOC130590776 [Beta vulgaris subsp. vulgaris]|uniref:uncharacterized protein LOC130590776 n=1 Tax=Beta vulgaris subsp. vulgaris TaxID=3555 RepID=UPI0025486723|nr:uncharacterized protein LOC130590776 [Beta vulgaris subsp. vulgaris]
MAADALSKLASSSLSDKKRNVRVETLVERSIEVVPASVNTITSEPEWYEGILAYKLKVCHPQSNGQAEAANKQILNALKKRLDELKGAWADMVPAVLWSNRTTEKEATGETPFRLAFGAEVVLPVEVGLPNWRILNYEPVLNEQIHKEDLDLLPEIRLATELRSAAYKDRISKAYNKRV